jgi:thiamine pyrophosphate-dependent acetolactate synthase large subunit-like protein
VLVVLDNERYSTTGGQDTATAHGADLAEAARALGFAATATVRSADALSGVLDRTTTEPGPWMIVAKVDGSTPTAKPPLDCVFIKQRFMAAIGCTEPATGGEREN